MRGEKTFLWGLYIREEFLNPTGWDQGNTWDSFELSV